MTICSPTLLLVSRARTRRKNYIIRDRKLKGFLLRITPQGQRSFVLQPVDLPVRGL